MDDEGFTPDDIAYINDPFDLADLEYIEKMKQ